MVKSVRKRVQELIKREGRGSQGIVSRTSGVPQSQLCQWLMGKYVAVRPALSRPVVRSYAMHRLGSLSHRAQSHGSLNSGTFRIPQVRGKRHKDRG